MRSSFAVCCAVLALSGSVSAEPAAWPNPAASVHARSDALTRAERDRLVSGGLVARPIDFVDKGGQYVGGLSYQLVRASPEEVLATLLDVQRLPEVLPRTKSARLISASSDDALVEITQGNSLVEATYSVRLVHDLDAGEIRFWLEPARPHDVHDVWGYFKVHRFDAGRSLLTVGVALDLGPGLARMFFERQIQSLVLGTPRNIRDFVEPRALAARD